MNKAGGLFTSLQSPDNPQSLFSLMIYHLIIVISAVWLGMDPYGRPLSSHFCADNPAYHPT